MSSWRLPFLIPQPLLPRSRPITRVILWSLGLAYAAQLYYGFWLQDFETAHRFTFSLEAWDAGRWWTLFTYGWIHSEALPLHILANWLMLSFLGSLLEQALGVARYVTLYFIAGLLAAALTWWAIDAQPGVTIGGASGAVFAFLGAAAMLWPRWKLKVLIFFIIPVGCRLRTLFWTLMLIELVCWQMGWLAWIGHTAHLGGGLAGALLAWTWRPRKGASEIIWADVLPGER